MGTDMVRVGRTSYDGMAYDEILTDYAEVEHDDILAVLEFAALDSAARVQPVVA